MRFLEFARRNFLNIWRDPIALGFLIGMPLAFMLIFGFAFGEEHQSKLSLGVIDQDSTATSAGFVKLLKNFPPEAPSFEVKSFDKESEAREEVKKGHLLGYLIIPQGFGERIQQTRRGMDSHIPLKLVYDETKQWVVVRATSMTRAAALAFAGIEVPLDFEEKGMQINVERSYFNFIAVGMIIYGLMILIPTLVRTMTKDKETGFLARLRTTPMRAGDFLLGYYLPMALVAIIQIIIYLVVAFPMGLRAVGNLGLAFGFFFLCGLCCLGFGLIIGSLARSEAQGEPICWIFLIPMAMLSGAWFPVEGMHPALLWLAKLFPFYYACEASRHVISLGTSFSMVLTDLLILVVWTLISFALGVFLFQRRSLQP